MELPAKIAALTGALLLVVAAPAPAQEERSLLRDGNRLYDANKFSDAEVSYRKALELNKGTLHGPFNLGDALYRQDRFDEAAEQYRAAAERTEDKDVKAQAMHNLGNALLRSKKYPESIASYKEALKLNPKDAETKYNLEYAKQMLRQEQQQQQQQKQDQKKDQNKDKQKKDQQKQDQQKQDQEKQDQQKQDQQKQQAPRKQEISKADAERILEALKNEEKNVKKKLQKKAPVRVQVEKDW